MGADTRIEWATHTFNPWRGCTKVAAGCTNCYAEAWSKRSPGTLGVWGDRGTRVVASDAYWRQPLKWAKSATIARVRCAESGLPAPPRPRVFCASLADVFEEWGGDLVWSDGVCEGVRCMTDTRGARLCTRTGREIERQWPDEAGWRPYCLPDARARLFRLIEKTPELDYLLLTKRPENIARMVPEEWLETPRPNVWYGTSIACQEDADRDIPILLQVPAAVRFVSAEPLIEAVTIFSLNGPVDVPDGEPSPLHWVIIGGESGPRARPCDREWIRGLRDQAKAAGVACFIKQMGASCYEANHRVRYKDPKGGDPSEWPEDLRVREVPR